MKRIRNRRFSTVRFAPAFRLLACGSIGLGMAFHALAAVDNGKAESFKLREVSAFEKGDSRFLRGQSGPCSKTPLKEVAAYPEFKSSNPIYGSVRFGGRIDAPDTAATYYFALDESRGTGKGYDRFYFDLNRDLDLRNDPVLKPQSRPPEGAMQSYSSIKQQVVFELLDVEFNFGAAGTRKVPLLPRLVISAYEQKEYEQVSFVRTRVWEGDIKIGGREYQAKLGNDYAIRGPLDDPATALVLSTKDGSGEIYWWGGDRLMAVHNINGRFYTFSASPTGDQLTVHPYAGELGTFEIGPGARKLDKMTVTGSLESKDRAVPVGADVQGGSPKAARSCQIPTGDYSPNYVSVEFGRLRISMSQNYHSDGKPRDRAGRPPVYGIAIRADKPYVLDFSNKPEVMFASPAREQRIKAGDTLEVKAVLTDPKLDIMIRGLDDTTRQQTKDAEGRALGYQRNLSLDPIVIITRTNGEKVAEGVMPFG